MNKVSQFKGINKRKSLVFLDSFSGEDIENSNCCNHLCKALPLVCKNLKLKLQDHLLLGGEHTIKVSPDFNSPQVYVANEKLSSEEKKNSVICPIFVCWSFKYHFGVFTLITS